MVSPETRAAHAAIISDLRRLAIRVVDPIHFDAFEFLRAADGTRQSNEAYLRSFAAPYPSIFDVLSSGRVLPKNALTPMALLYRVVSALHTNVALSPDERRAALEDAMVQFAVAKQIESKSLEEIQRIIDSSPILTALFRGPDFCLAHKEKMRAKLEELMALHGVDVLVYPETPYGPAYAEVCAGSVHVTGYNSPLATITQMPTIVVPGGNGTLPEPYRQPGDRPRPFGVEFMARKYEDRKLLQAAHAYERLTQHRRPPSIERGAVGTRGPEKRVDIARFNDFKLEVAEAFFELQCTRSDLGDAELANELRKLINAMRG
jgi:Asp-tRNA(Asn)/Glu-tRNA(Gln) amidotransferase A subunit family amidase